MPRFAYPLRGFTLVELMIGITLGLLLVAGLTTIFVQSSDTHREMQKAAQQIENGRHAIDLLSQDIKHAGFYGEFFLPPVPGATLPDPCETANAADLLAALAFPIQGYTAPDFTTAADLSSTTCAAYGLTAANLLPGSDVIVVRRAETNSLDPRNNFTVTSNKLPVLNEIYLQANTTTAEIQFGNPQNFAFGLLNSANGVVTIGTRASGTATPVLRKANVAGTSPVVASLRLAADIRKWVVRVYFVAPCSLPYGGGNVCTGPQDDAGKPIPTLKRLELASVGGAATMRLVPLVEGIDRLRVEYGIDNLPSTANAATGLIGDGSPDDLTHSPTVVDWPNVVIAKLYVLVRNTEGTTGYADAKTYALGLAGTPAAANDQYKRHLFNGAARLANVSGRREIP